MYDALNPWGPSDAYYLDLIASVDSALDLACGTGQLLRRAAGDTETATLVGVDLSAAMLAEAARTPTRVVWRRGDARTVDLGSSFELVVMTGHAFQEFLTDDDVLALLANVRRHLVPGGRFAFETRNPAAKAWEQWTPERSRRTVSAPTGELVEIAHGPVELIEPDVVEFPTTCRFKGSSSSLEIRGGLRFMHPEHLRTLLVSSGFRIDGWFGDWSRTPVTTSSPEVVVVASPV